MLCTADIPIRYYIFLYGFTAFYALLEPLQRACSSPGGTGYKAHCWKCSNALSKAPASVGRIMPFASSLHTLCVRVCFCVYVFVSVCVCVRARACVRACLVRFLYF